MSSLPQTHKALHLTAQGQPLTLRTFPTPQPTPGSAVIRIHVSNILSYSRDIYDGTRPYKYATPLIPGASAIGRVAAVGPDASVLKEDDLVYIDALIRGRDDPSAAFLLGISEGFTEGSRKLMAGEWRDATYAEYTKVPLENCVRLDEKLLKPSPEGLGYSIGDLAQIPGLSVPYGGLRDIDLKVGETVVVAPATGPFGGWAVLVALALGARVIAMGRDTTKLAKLKETVLASGVDAKLIHTVPITGDLEADTTALQVFGEPDAFFDISPPFAAGSTHIKSAILSLRHEGRVSLMGGIRKDIDMPYNKIMHWNLKVQGKWMYEREDITTLIRIIESGRLKLGENASLKVVGSFGLDDWKEAFDMAAERNSFGEIVLFKVADE